MLIHHLNVGNTEPAIVMNEDPLLIAVYSIELDCVILLGFDEKYTRRFQYKKGQRLISINTYGAVENMQEDIILGKYNTQIANSIWPIISDMICTVDSFVSFRIQDIHEVYWNRLETLAQNYIDYQLHGFRDGAPMQSYLPPTYNAVNGHCPKCQRSTSFLINGWFFCKTCEHKYSIIKASGNKFVRPIISVLIMSLVLCLNLDLYNTVSTYEGSIQSIKNGHYKEAQTTLKVLYEDNKNCKDFAIWYAIACYKSGDASTAKSLLRSKQVYNSITTQFLSIDFINSITDLDSEMNNLIKAVK